MTFRAPGGHALEFEQDGTRGKIMQTLMPLIGGDMVGNNHCGDNERTLGYYESRTSSASSCGESLEVIASELRLEADRGRRAVPARSTGIGSGPGSQAGGNDGSTLVITYACSV